jgi:hypothetical protein
MRVKLLVNVFGMDTVGQICDVVEEPSHGRSHYVLMVCGLQPTEIHKDDVEVINE